MEAQNNKLNRRGFIVNSSLAGVGLTLGTSALLASNFFEDRSENGKSFSAKKEYTPLHKRKLGSLEVSEIGFGCMNIAWAYGNPPEKQEAIKLIRSAYEEGIRFFDTAEIYGPFISEEITGEALSPFKNDVVIATKFGFNISPQGSVNGLSSHPDTIRRVAEQSLKRLKIEVIDLFYQHRVDPNIPIEDVAGTIANLVKEGKVKHYGLSEAGAATIRRAHAEHPVTAVQNEYSFWTRDPEAEILPVCEELGIGFVPWSPLGMGYLTGKVTPDYEFSAGDIRKNLNFPRFTKEALEKNRPLIELLQSVADRYDATTGQIALAWLMAKKPFIVPIPGTRIINHMKENRAAADIRLTPDDMTELERGFLSTGVFGDRAPEGLKASHDIGTSLGTTSIGTNGKTPLPKR